MYLTVSRLAIVSKSDSSSKFSDATASEKLPAAGSSELMPIDNSYHSFGIINFLLLNI